jgi:putative oxidoreductase
MNDTLILGSRLVLGGYLAVHGAQKLFGAFEGPGLEQAGQGFEHLGLTPGKPMAALAGGSELVGGALLAAGAAHPLGPIAIGGSMTVAALVHAPQGPMGQKGGYEQAATNLALAGLLAAVGTGKYAVGLHLPKSLARISLVGAAGLTALSVAKILRKRREPAPVETPVAEIDVVEIVDADAVAAGA